jgi:pyridoxal phosphate enzyme (YggS family)
MDRAQQIADGLARVRVRIARAEQDAGRPAGSVRLIAVSKKMPVDDIRAALAAGQHAFGENYAQELRDKLALLADDRTSRTSATPPAPPEWHFIGPLQSNKLKYVAGRVALLHSVDSAALLDAVEARAVSQACLIQVNVAGEQQKRGVSPQDLPALLDRFTAMKWARCEGLMLIPPLGQTAPHFEALRALSDREATCARPNVTLRELSMGMSNDLEVAIAHGATIVRVGTAIFGTRLVARQTE